MSSMSSSSSSSYALKSSNSSDSDISGSISYELFSNAPTTESSDIASSDSSYSLTSLSATSNELAPLLIPQDEKCFFDASTQQRQNFAFPAPIIEYIAMNPASAKVYQKLIQTCKYFFARNPILVVSTISHCNCIIEGHAHGEGWKIRIKSDSDANVDPPLLLKYFPESLKIWPTESVTFIEYPKISANPVTFILPRLYQLDNKILQLAGQKLSLNQFKIFSSNVEIFKFICLKIKDDDVENGNLVPLEDIVAHLPKLKHLEGEVEEIITPKTVQKLCSIPHLKNLIKFRLVYIPETFEIDAFCEFMIKNKNIEYELHFAPDISQIFKDRIQACKERLSNEIYENGQKCPQILPF